MPLTQPHQSRPARQMAGGLIRAFTNVDEKGRVFIPDNIRHNVGIEPGQLVEIQIIGGSSDKQTMKLVIHQFQKTNRG